MQCDCSYSTAVHIMHGECSIRVAISILNILAKHFPLRLMMLKHHRVTPIQVPVHLKIPVPVPPSYFCHKNPHPSHHLCITFLVQRTTSYLAISMAPELASKGSCKSCQKLCSSYSYVYKSVYYASIMLNA